MNRFDIQDNIEEMLDTACSQLRADEFEVLLIRVKEMIENYEQ